MSALVVAVVALGLLGAWLAFQVVALRRKVDAVPDDGNVVAVLRDLDARLRRAEEVDVELDRRIGLLEAQMPFAVSRVGVVAYDAFGNIAGNLSRAIAFLSDRGDGLVLSVLVARAETLFYAKEVRGGHGTEELSPEERLAVDRALGR